MVIGSAYATVMVDPFEDLRERIVDMIRPIIESFEAIIRPTIESIARSLATIHQDFEPLSVALGPQGLGTMTLAIKIDPRVLDVFKREIVNAITPATQIDYRLLDGLRPSLEANRATMKAAQATLGQASIPGALHGRTFASSGAVPPAAAVTPTSWSTRAQRNWVNMSLVEQLVFVYVVVILLRVMAHAGHAAVDPTVDYNPSAALIGSFEAILDNAAVTVSAILVGRRLGG